MTRMEHNLKTLIEAYFAGGNAAGTDHHAIRAIIEVLKETVSANPARTAGATFHPPH